MKFERDPSISPKPMTEFSPQEYHDYVKGLFIAPEAKPPSSQLTFKVTKTGKLSLTIRRKPQWVMWDELQAVATTNKVSFTDLYVMVKHKKEAYIFNSEKQKMEVLGAITELDESWPVGQNENDNAGADAGAD